MPVAYDLELVAAQFAKPHRTASVKLVCGYPDLGPEPKFETISKTRTDIPVLGGGIHSNEKFFRSLFICS